MQVQHWCSSSGVHDYLIAYVTKWTMMSETWRAPWLSVSGRATPRADNSGDRTDCNSLLASHILSRSATETTDIYDLIVISSAPVIAALWPLYGHCSPLRPLPCRPRCRAAALITYDVDVATDILLRSLGRCFWKQTSLFFGLYLTIIEIKAQLNQ